ncbi:glyoxalase [Nocardioides mangrovicus]|uniref:Glyoxalase n=1 Tax=Nocardioides mangrovicus TaxID=2478913 RepID=A0A3L8P6I8_9ACTN|nr:VOC family protein [Nocardioides mangrovicus]RLV50058.1 glyoxalase [Nocardioides mangrovicus]
MNDARDSPDTVTEVPDQAPPPPDEADRVRPGGFLLELVPIPVSDLDRAKSFYADSLGFHVDVDVAPADGVRIVQLTPTGSACSILLTEGIADLDGEPGSIRRLYLVVRDIEAARAELVGRGVEVAEIVDAGGGMLLAGFADPDGNTWTLQYMPWR